MWPFGLIMSDRYQHGKGMPGNGAVYVHKNGTAFIIESGDDGWINFYQANKRYGYHPEEKRWANKDKPDDSQAWLTKARSEGFYQTGSSDKKNSAKAKAAGGANAVIGCLGLIILIFFGVVLILFLVGK